LSAVIFPADAVSGSPNFTGQMARITTGALAGGKTSARPLGCTSGVTVGTPTTIATATSSTWTVTPFSGLIDVETTVTTGPYQFAFDSNQTGSVTAAHATLDRWDRLDVQMDDPATGDGTAAPAVRVVYTAGTAASSPALPSAPARSFFLAKIVVPHSGSGSPSVTWSAPCATAAGGIAVVSDSTAYPSSPYNGRAVWDLALKALVVYNGGWGIRGSAAETTQYQEFIPSSVLSADVAGAALVDWLTIGTFTCPSWATQAIVAIKVIGAYEATAAGTTYHSRAKLGSALGDNVVQANNNTGINARLPAIVSDDLITSLTPGSLTLTLQMDRVAGTGVFRVDASSKVSAIVQFLP
jgi:hypothetical protein